MLVRPTNLVASSDHVSPYPVVLRRGAVFCSYVRICRITAVYLLVNFCSVVYRIMDSSRNQRLAGIFVEGYL